jgi:DNA-directed RNA polymerase subunit RPC12/RpoP
MKRYGYYIEGDGIICPKCGDNPLYKDNPLYAGVLTTAEAEGYPDGYTCADCGIVVTGEEE